MALTMTRSLLITMVSKVKTGGSFMTIRFVFSFYPPPPLLMIGIHWLTSLQTQWQYGRRGQDGWAKWTRRRKWYRDAELVEIEDSDLPPPEEEGLPRSPTTAHDKTYSTASEKMVPTRPGAEPESNTAEPNMASSGDQPATDDDGASILSTSSKSSFWPSSLRRRTAADKERPSILEEKDPPKSSTFSEAALPEDDGATILDLETELELQREGQDGGGRWGIGDDARMNLE